MKPKLTYANVVATLALFIAIGGATAFAASKLPNRSVGEPQLRPGAVTAEKLRTNAVTAPKIKAGAVKQGKLASGSVTAAKMTAGAIENGSLAPNSVTNDKIAPEAVTGDKIAENTLSQVPSASRADFAVNAESGNPPAFASVSKEATLNTSQSKNVSVREGNLAGIYCVSVSGFNPAGVQVTPQFEGGGPISVFAKIGGTASCPAPQVEVQTYEGTARTREPFYVALYR